MDGLPLSDRVDQTRKQYGNDPFRLEQELRKLLREAKKAEDVYALGKINLLLSVCIFYQGERESILSYAYKAVRILETLNDHQLLARSYNLLGVAYSGQGNYQRAVAVYKKALRLIQGRKITSVRRETLLNNIAQCYARMGEYRKAVQLVKECLTTVRAKRPDLHSAPVIYGLNLSDFYETLGDYRTSMAYLDDVKADAEQLDNDVVLWGYYARRGCVLYKLGNPAEGARFADLAVESVRSGYDSYEIHADFERIAFSQIEAGDFARAQSIADILAKYAEKNLTLDKIIAKRVQAYICYGMGRREEALVLFKELDRLYEAWTDQQKSMQYEAQKSVKAASREIAKLMEKVRVSEEKAERDPMTGLMNRSALVSITDEFTKTAREQGKKLGSIFFDIDYFKEYNDIYGHTDGDEIIKFVANVCLKEENASVRFFRYGGDEFFGVALGCNDREIESLALRIRDSIRASGYEHAGNPNGQRVTVSIGVANVDGGKSDVTILDLLQFADKALYHAKQQGRDSAFLYCDAEDAAHECLPIVENKQ